MAERGDSRVVRIYRALLRLYPREWGMRYGGEVVEVFRRRLDAARMAGPGAVARLLLREAAGTLLAAGRVWLRRFAGSGKTREGPTNRGKGGGGMRMLAQDVRFALRSLARNPGFTLTAVVVLSIGIGATAAIFSAVDAVLLRPLPFPDPDRLVMLWEHNPEKGWWKNSSAPANLLDWREGVDAFEDVAAHGYGTIPAAWMADGEPVELRGVSITGNFFDVLGVPAALGRTTRWEETWAGADDVVVLSHDAWVRHFGSDPGVVGRRVELAGSRVEVVGVMPAAFRFPDDEADFWIPFGWDPAFRSQVWFRRAHFVWPFARLAEGVSPEEADAELQAVVVRLQEEYPETNRVMGAHLSPLHEFLVGDEERPLWIVMGAVGLLLLVACANVGNLQLVRSAARARELAVRKAIGAGAGRVTTQLLAESLVLALAGGAIGLGLGWLGVRVLSDLRPVGIEGVGGVALDGRVVLFTLAVALASGVLFGFVPALRGARRELVDDLRDGGRGSGDGPGRLRAVHGLVVAEIAIALVLVAGAGLLGRSFWGLYTEDGGFRVENVMTFRLYLTADAYDPPEARMAFWRGLEERAEALPEVRDVAIASDVPLVERGFTSDYSIDDWPPERAGFEVNHRTVTPDYFRVMDVPLVAGRLPEPGEGMEGDPVVLVNEAFVREAFPDGEDPVGHRVANDRIPSEESTWRTIIGVVGNERIEGMGRPPRPEIIEPLGQDLARGYRVVVWTEGDPAAALPGLRAAVRELNPRLPLTSVLSMREIRGDSLAREQFLLLLVSIFGAVALLLAAVGVYGVTAQATRRRTREIGVRMAMGAEPGSVRRMVLLQGMRLGAAGIALGLLGALATSRVLASVLYETAPNDPATLGGVAAVLGAMALAASWVPALRATRVSPSEALRVE